MMNKQTTVFALAYLIGFVVVIGLTIDPIDPGGPDDGLLHLAGATALLNDADYPIVQRPPIYSALLAGLAIITGIDTSATAPLAQELGSIEHLAVATEMLDTTFLRSALILNMVFWVLTALMVILICRELGIPQRDIMIAMLLMLTPSSWAALRLVSETPLASFLLALGVISLTRSVTRYPTTTMVIVAGMAFSLAAMTRATFRLLPPLLVIFMAVVFWRRFHFTQVLRYSLPFILPFLMIVGGWSTYNQQTYGFFGVSGVTGVALSTRTARIVDRASTAYPEEALMFQRLRDETYLAEPNKDNVVYWGARASNWLMAESGLTYLEANRLLTRYNLAAIRSSPLTYVDTTLSSLIDFQYPGVDDSWSPLPRLLWWGVEFVLMAVFLGGLGLWAAAHILARLGFFAPRWRPLDTVIVMGMMIYGYTAIIASAIDVGKPQQRFSVQFLIPLIIVLVTQIGALRPLVRQWSDTTRNEDVSDEYQPDSH